MKMNNFYYEDVRNCKICGEHTNPDREICSDCEFQKMIDEDLDNGEE